MKGFLVALKLNRTICAHSMVSRTMGFISSPLSAAFEPARHIECAAMMKKSISFTSITGSLNESVAINTGPWTGADHGFPQTKALAQFYGIGYEQVLACVSNALFRPSDEVRRYSAPYLRKFHGADYSLGIHIRSGDFAMAQHQGYHGKRMLSLSKHRQGSLSEDVLAKQFLAGLPLKCSRGEPAPTRAVIFVGGDRFLNLTVWRNLASDVTVLKTPGHPIHTGRPAVNVDERSGALKSVVDFFLLTEVEWFASNVNYMMSAGNTYAQNIHRHREPTRERFERVAPSYDCQYILELEGDLSRGFCSTTSVTTRSNHSAFSALGAGTGGPRYCGLRNFPELTPGPKKGDDDKRLCSTFLHEISEGDVIISLGSNNEFAFEEQMLRCAPQGAHLATFDCTVREATNKPRTSRVSFHPYCIGDANQGVYRTWESISSLALEAASEGKRGVGRVAVLKMDVEGWEWTALPQVYQTSPRDISNIMPRQIAVEMHLKTHSRYNVPGFIKKGGIAILPDAPSKLIKLIAAMNGAGYSFVDRNDNPFCAHCSELLFAIA